MIESEVLHGTAVETHEDRLARMFDAHYVRLFRLARRLSRHGDEAQDLVQETFVRAAQSRRIPADERGEEAWLIRVLVNLCRDRWRRARLRRHEAVKDDAACASPQRAYDARLEVQQALAVLPPRRRAIVVMREFEDLDVAQIAGVLGVAAVTVRWHLSRARRQLAQALGGRARTLAPQDRDSAADDR